MQFSFSSSRLLSTRKFHRVTGNSIPFLTKDNIFSIGLREGVGGFILEEIEAILRKKFLQLNEKENETYFSEIRS